MTQKSLLLSVAIVLLQLFLIGRAVPARSQLNSECSRLDPSQPLHYLTYEGASFGDIRLRLRNNSSCPITLQTDLHEPFNLRGETWIAPRYFLHRKGQTLREVHEGWGHVVSTTQIKGGDSVLFRIPIIQLKKGWGIAVPFSYGWENHVITTDANQHLVFFSSDEVPPNIRQRK